MDGLSNAEVIDREAPGVEKRWAASGLDGLRIDMAGRGR